MINDNYIRNLPPWAEVIYVWPLASALWVPSALSSSPAAYCSDYRLWIVTMAEYELWAAFLKSDSENYAQFSELIRKGCFSIRCAAARKPSSRFVLGSRFLPSDSLKKTDKKLLLVQYNLIWQHDTFYHYKTPLW